VEGMSKLEREMKMKKIVTVTEVDGEGLVGLLGKQVLIFCMNYIYTGTLSGVNNVDILLENPSIVYETGAFDSKKFGDAQKLPNNLYIRTNSIESYHETDKS
jgi:hypothetical protein